MVVAVKDFISGRSRSGGDRRKAHLSISNTWTVLFHRLEPSPKRSRARGLNKRLHLYHLFHRLSLSQAPPLLPFEFIFCARQHCKITAVS